MERKIQLLFLLVLLCSVSVKSFAADDRIITSAQSLKDYLGSKASINGTTVSLSDDISTNITDWGKGIKPSKLIIKGGPITLQLNGHTLKGYTPFRFEIQSGGSLIVENGKITTSVNPVITVKGGSLIMRDLELYNATDKVLETTSIPLLNCLDKGYGYYIKGSFQSSPGNTLGEGTDLFNYLMISKISYTLKYNTMSENSLSDQSYNIGTPLDNLSTPAREDYNFVGWYFDANYTNPANDLSSNNFYPNNSETVTIYAKWTPTPYTISFDSQGGSAIEKTEYDITQTIYLKENNNYVERYKPTYTYYTFEGWYKNAEGKDPEVTQIGPNQIGDISLFAKWSKTQYTISYDCNGGSLVSGANYPKSYQYEDDITIGEATHGNDKFGGWKDLSNGKILQDNKLPGDNPHDLKLEAVWDKEYTIKFNTGTEEVTNPTDITLYVSKTATLPSVSKNKTGYTFGGWKDPKDPKGTVYSAGEEVQFSGDLTLEAVWNIETYTVTFTDGAYEQKETYQIGTGSQVQFPTRDKEGWIFNGWKDASGIVKNISNEETGNRSFTADWTEISYTLTYDYADEKTSPYTYTYTYTQAGQQVLRTASREGYNFLGWFLPGSETKLEKVPVKLSDTQKTFSFTVTAKWEIQNYKVVFYLNDGTGAALSEKEYTYNVTTGISSDKMPKNPERTGYKFGGWYKNESSSGEEVKSVPAGVGEVGNPLCLYAKWTPNTYSITYNWNGGETVSSAPSTFVYNEGATLPAVEVMKREHYTFVGWTNDAASATWTVIPANTEGPLSFTAQWEPKVYTVRFETNGGSTLSDLPYKYGAEEKLKKTYKAGYTFETWCYDAALTQPFGDKITAEKVLDGMSDQFTLYAKWTPTKKTITYDTYYGKISSGKVDTYTIEQEVTLPTDVHREGFTFADWYADDLLTTKITKIEKGNYGDKTVYATWDRGYQLIVTQPLNGKITVTRNGSAVAAGSMVGKGETLVVSASATTSGYALKKLTINGKDYAYSPQSVTMPEKDLVITAEFSASSLPSLSAPKIVTDPASTDKVAFGTKVKVTLEKSDASSTLYFALNDQLPRVYEGEFLVDGNLADTVVVYGIARKDGYSDGIATRKVIFDGRIELTFDLPTGVKATNPTGGEVVAATVKGGSFEFKLDVDTLFFASLDSMQVLANDSVIKPNASGLYTLTNQTGNVKVKVSGLTQRECTVTLVQVENGQIAFADATEEDSLKVAYGDTVSLVATADADFKFLEWSDGNQSNPRQLAVTKDISLSASFVSDYKSYAMILPEMEGVTVKPFSGYTTEVKRGETFMFYLVVAKGYHETNLVVKANGEVLAKNKGGYAIYKVDRNVSISVEGIERDTVALVFPSAHVSAWDLNTQKDATKQPLFDEDHVLLYAEAQEGQVFYKWNDGKVDNPRVATVVEAAQLIPLYNTAESGESYAKVDLRQSAGAGIAALDVNVDAVHKGEDVRLKVVVLPSYSQSQVVLTANGKTIEPQTTLRASTETRTYLYTLPDIADYTEVKLSGLALNTYKLMTEQTAGGSVSASASSAKHGETIRLQATPSAGMIFTKWWDGNTVNPYPYQVTSDVEVKALFMGEASTVANEEIEASAVRLRVSGSTLYIESAEAAPLYLWDYKGSLLYRLNLPAGTYPMPLPAGIYLVKVGDNRPEKVVVR